MELKEKAQLVAENREKTLEEVKTRMAAWHRVMEDLLKRVNVEYQRIMIQTLATGEVLLSKGQEIETAGLDIYVGFKGGKPVALDAYTQSGGESTTATWPSYSPCNNTYAAHSARSTNTTSTWTQKTAK